MIKNWLQFITESQQLELFPDEGLFPYTDEDIMDFLLELEDAGYGIEIKHGFLDSDNRFTKKVESMVEEPVIGVEIWKYQKVSDEDVTSCVSSFIKRVSKKAKAVRLYDNDGELDIKFLKFQGGIFLNERPEDSEPDEAGNYHDIELEEPIWINIIFNQRRLTYKEILEYYGIKGSYIKTTQGDINALSYLEDGTPVFEVEVEDLVRWCVSRNDSYAKYITNPDAIWDWYVGSFDYTPDHQSFFQYHLTRENIKLLLQVCIKLDGWDEIKQKLENPNITQEEFLEESVEDWRGYSELGKMIDSLLVSQDVYNDIRRDYVSWEESAKAQEDLEEIISKFDDLVEEQFKTTILKKNKYVAKSIKTNKQGEKYEYEFEFETYQLKFTFDWFENLDAEKIHDCGSTYNLLLENTESIYTEDLKPHFSDYASVDDVAFNREVKRSLESLLKKD